MPSEWRIDQNGMLCIESFVDVSVIESRFKTSVRYSYFLAKKLEGIVEQDYGASQKTFIPDVELREIVRQMIHQDYGKDSVADLDVNARLSIARKLRYNYASTLKQISRMVKLDQSVLGGFI